jgi:hypothetical protein
VVVEETRENGQLLTISRACENDYKADASWHYSENGWLNNTVLADF